MHYNKTMEKESIRAGIKIVALVGALLFIYGVAIPFIMSDDFDRLAIEYGLDELGRKIFWPNLTGR
jgi:hypothetical protein